VNLAALEELTTARERKQFLDAQSADLTEAMNTLEDAIRKIDGETRELLSGTFNTVNEHFGRMFPELFGGGKAGWSSPATKSWTPACRSWPSRRARRTRPSTCCRAARRR
jgi:hypothetical protein